MLILGPQRGTLLQTICCTFVQLSVKSLTVSVAVSVHSLFVDAVVKMNGKYYCIKCTNVYTHVNGNMLKVTYQKQAVREAATICPAPCKLTFDLLTLKVVSES